MACVRCGRCCFYLVVVVSDKYKDTEELNLRDLKDDDFVCVDGVKTFCPHLTWDDHNDVAVCKIHDKKWFNQTPCYRHNNPEFGELINCRIGPYIRENDELFNHYKNLIKEMY